MCDYSLLHAKSRPAVVGDKLIVRDMGSRTYGLADSSEKTMWGYGTAVCLLPGTEVVFDAPVKRYNLCGTWRDQSAAVVELKSSVGIFCQVDKENLCTHHDAFEFAEDHDRVLINHLVEGQRVTVLQLPAAPKTSDEAKEQERVAVVA